MSQTAFSKEPFTMNVKHWKTWLYGASLIGCVHCTGCADGPFYQLKHLNPVIRKQWDEDRAMGPTYDDRLAEVRKLKGHLANCPAEEKQKWVGHLQKLVANDPSPEIRREAILATKNLPASLNRPILQQAAQDKNEKVRIASCEALSVQGDENSLQMLGTLATTDESNSVRVAAVGAIGNYKGEPAKQLLAKVIQDRSPVLQYQATLALQEVTGKNLGGDVGKWKRYLQGEEVEEEETSSMAKTLSNWTSIR